MPDLILPRQTLQQSKNTDENQKKTQKKHCEGKESEIH